MAKKDIVVIGASAGGMEALQGLVSHLPQDIRASLFIVWHLPPGLKSVLPRLLTKAGPLEAVHATDAQEIEPGRIYVAPSDCHMLVEQGFIRVAHGPRENRFRPAIDPLFRSAAYVYGARVIGVVLSGALSDGTAGLWTIKLRGGTAIAQEPQEALHPSMPLNAIGNVAVDHTAPVAEIGALLGRLTREEAAPTVELPIDQARLIESEVRIAENYADVSMELFQKSELSPFTCPECHGVLAKMSGGVPRFRCHTGHAVSAESLLDSLQNQVEARLGDAARAIDESVMLLNHLGSHLDKGGRNDVARRYYEKAKETGERAGPLRELARAENMPG
jgi:two-component system, chemotaxis family, protein-glutamate methylesterase/glutaminase